MLHGRVVRPATVNTKPASVDESSIKSIAGIVKVVQEGSFLGVVAQTEWGAIQAAKALQVTWSAPERKYPSTKEEVFDYLKNTKSARDQAVVSHGDADAAISQAGKTFEATYHWPFQLHGMLGPSCAVADVPAECRDGLGRFARHLQHTEAGGEPAGDAGEKRPSDLPRRGGMLRPAQSGRCSSGCRADNARAAVGKPVRVQWTRDDEHGWEPKGPAQILSVRAAMDGSGKVAAWDFVDRSLPWTENGNPLLAARQVGHDATSTGNGNGNGGGGQIYRFDNQKVVASMIPWIWPDPMPLRTSNLRAPGDVARCFASESALDEIASLLRVGSRGLSAAVPRRSANRRRAQCSREASAMECTPVAGTGKRGRQSYRQRGCGRQP